MAKQFPGLSKAGSSFAMVRNVGQRGTEKMQRIDWIGILMGVAILSVAVIISDNSPIWFSIICGFCGAFIMFVVIFGQLEVVSAKKRISRRG